MRISCAKAYRTLTAIIAIVTALYVCIVINNITFGIGQRRLLAYLRRILSFANLSFSRDVTSGYSTLQVPHFNDFVQALTARADADRYIILAMTDESFMDMAINFYEASLRAHDVENFLFVGVGRNTCDRLSRFLIPCFYYTNDPSEAADSYWGHKDFIRKMNIRTDMILDALAANFTVIHTDTDVAFFANPVQQLKKETKSSDLSALCETTKKMKHFYNPGFIVVKPTLLSCHVYRRMRNITNRSTVTDDLMALNQAISELNRENIGINVTFLDKRVYMNGREYFEDMKRMDGFCSSVNNINCSVLVVHNNWIVSKAAKIHRFREHLMWLYDGEDQYYSSQTRKYLTYTNAKPAALMSSEGNQLKKRQLSALATALSIGYLLNRTVILPKFYCGKPSKMFQCPLNSIIHIKTFDTLLSQRYRENSFLQHPHVPVTVKQNILDQQLVLHTIRSSLRNKVNKISSNDVIRLYRNSKHKVINFGILDGIQVINDSTGATINREIFKAFKLSNYRQMKVGKFIPITL